MSRRPPEAVSGRPFTHLAADLQDEAICRAAFRGRRDIHHVVDTAVYEGPGLIAGESEQDQRQANPAVLCKLLAPLAADDALEHVSLLQGCKAAAPHAVPARELSPIVGAFAAICREMGLPLGFPGGAYADFCTADGATPPPPGRLTRLFDVAMTRSQELPTPTPGSA